MHETERTTLRSTNVFLGHIATLASDSGLLLHTEYRGLLVCVCVSIGHVREPCENGWTDRDTTWVAESGGPNKPYITWGANPQGVAATFGGCPVHWKAWESQMYVLSGINEISKSLCTVYTYRQWAFLSLCHQTFQQRLILQYLCQTVSDILQM